MNLQTEPRSWWTFPDCLRDAVLSMRLRLNVGYKGHRAGQSEVDPRPGTTSSDQRADILPLAPQPCFALPQHDSMADGASRKVAQPYYAIDRKIQIFRSVIAELIIIFRIVIYN